MATSALDHRGRAQRQQPHQRSHLQAHRLAVGKPQQIIEEAVLLIPHLVVMLAEAVHGIGDPHEMLDELEGDLLVHRVVFAQDQGHLQHVLAVERHPGGAVRLLQRAARGQLRAAVEDADVVEAQKAAGEDVAPRWILAVDPPVEVQHQSLKRAFQESQVRPAQLPLIPVQVERGPGVHRRIDVAEVPLVGGNLPARVEVQAAQHQQQLLLGKIEIHQRQGDGVEGQVPGRIPRVLPLVRHRDHVAVEHVEPLRVAHVVAGGFEQRMALVLAQPALQVEVVVLLGPQQSRQRLAVHPALVFVQRVGRNPLVEFVGVGDPALERLLEPAKGISCLGGGQTQPDGLAAAARHVEDIVGRGLGPRLGGIHRVAASRDDVLMERVLDIGRSIGLAPQTLRIALVFGEEQLRGAVTIAASTRQAQGAWPEWRRVPLRAAKACARHRPTTTCCGTTMSARHAAGPLPARDCAR